MKLVNHLVKSGGEIVDTVSVDAFETVEEAVENLGEATALRYINELNATKFVNAARTKATALTAEERALIRDHRAAKKG